MNDEPQGRLTYTVDEAAQHLGISARHLWRQIAQGRIRAVKIGRRTLISRAVLEALLDGDADAGGDSEPQPLLRVMT